MSQKTVLYAYYGATILFLLAPVTAIFQHFNFEIRHDWPILWIPSCTSSCGSS